jgi:hypothetical protein
MRNFLIAAVVAGIACTWLLYSTIQDKVDEKVAKRLGEAGGE